MRGNQRPALVSPLLPLLFPDDNSTSTEAAAEESSCDLGKDEGIRYFQFKSLVLRWANALDPSPGWFLPTQPLDVALSAYSIMTISLIQLLAFCYIGPPSEEK